ncbi:hypothetical protein BJ741DRAFT_610539 [Chytriomyces cf. hyalinus JEL632]|nr:hypothetical protein BJ741DRAFT_610539 [Chytriomyces cf. hyalinus JEL632]
MSNQQHPMNYSLIDDSSISLALLLDRRFSMPNARRMSFQPMMMTDMLTVSPRRYNRRMPYAMYHHHPAGDVPSSPLNVFSSLHSQQQQDDDLFPSSFPQKDLSSPLASYMFPPVQQQQQQQQGKNVDIAMFNQPIASAPVSPLISAMPLLEDKICSFEEQTPHQKPPTPAATTATPLKMNPSLATTTRFFWQTARNRGLDILMASPLTSPATLIHARPAFRINHRATMKIGGIHVLKPKRGNSASLNGDKKRASLSPLSSDSPYFYVRDGGAVVSKLQPIPLQF